MNQQAFDEGKAAYRSGDVNGAIDKLRDAKQPGEVSGTVDHLLGNCLMKLGRYDEAAAAYGDALQDTSYGNVGALACNRGRALLAAGKPQEAIAALIQATKDTSYPTPYKVQIALGNAYLKVGNAREAGVAFRNAAIDESNPDPSSALRNLGACFVQMARPIDAIEAYRTALDFASPQADQSAIYADLGMAYVAANRMGEAVDAFSRATSDGYVLSSEAQVAFDAAKRAATAISSGSPSETDQFLAAAGYGTGSFDPLDPMGESGEFMPSPEDTGFFSVSEKELVAQAKRDRKIKRKHKHTGLKVFLIILLLALILGALGGLGYYNGYGWPSQSAVVNELFSVKANGEDISGLLAPSVSEDEGRQIDAVLPQHVTDVKVTGIDRSMTESKVLCTVKLSAGSEQNYEIDLLRDGIGWKVASVTAVYASQNGTTPTLDGAVDPVTGTTTGTGTGTGATTESTTPTTTTQPTTTTPVEETPTEEPAPQEENTEATSDEGGEEQPEEIVENEFDEEDAEE